jgi:6-phosphogluconolactonase
VLAASDSAAKQEARVIAAAVEQEDLGAAAARYVRPLQQIADSLPLLDLAHLGLGADGRTASLMPGDPVLDITDQDVALTGIYQQRRRMTLTYRSRYFTVKMRKYWYSRKVCSAAR